MCILWIWKKRRENSRSGKRIVTDFVRPYALEGDVPTAAHNPNCSGTLNAVSRYLQNEHSETMLNKTAVLSELEFSEEQNPFHWVLKSLKIKYLFSFYQSIILQNYTWNYLQICIFSSKIPSFLTHFTFSDWSFSFETQNLPHWKWHQSNVLYWKC